MLKITDFIDELQIFVFFAEVHHAFNTGAVIPAAVEKHNFTGNGQMRYKALKIPCALLPVGRRAQRDCPRLPRAEVLSEALDGAILACRIPALKQNAHFFPFPDHTFVKLNQFHL